MFDALLRPGSELNLAWLHKRHPNLEFIHGDVRDAEAVKDAAADAELIYHLAAQVAVTSSVTDPRTDFEINALGTFNSLEAARLSGRQPIVVYTSTNKVYGGMEDVAVVEERARRYEFRDLPYGIAESQPLDFHSPYGCSKGAGDQYVRDYARIYDLPTVVFRMSCIYGPRQFGNGGPGLAGALHDRGRSPASRITIYGDGKQVRDVLFVDDLVRAFRLGCGADRRHRGAGLQHRRRAVQHAVRLAGVRASPGDVERQRIPVRFDRWRPGDQPCYVSDIRKAGRSHGLAAPSR